MSCIIVLAKVIPKNGCKDSIIELSEELIENSLKDDGNIDYKLVSCLDDDSLMFVEKWMTIEDLQKHMATPHFQTFGADSAEFVENMDIEVMGADKIDL